MGGIGRSTTKFSPLFGDTPKTPLSLLPPTSGVSNKNLISIVKGDEREIFFQEDPKVNSLIINYMTF